MANAEDKSTKRQIINWAVRLFKERGYNNVSVKDICRLGDISRGTFYYHFKSKDEIFDNYFLESEISITDNLNSILGSKSYVDQFDAVFDTFLAQILDAGPEIMAQVFKRNLDREIRQLAPRESAMWEVYVTILKKAQEAGEIRNPMPVEDLLESFLYLSNGISLIWCNKKGKLDLIGEHARLFDVVFQAGRRKGGFLTPTGV